METSEDMTEEVSSMLKTIQDKLCMKLATMK